MNTTDRATLANRATQLNPEHLAYHRARGLSPEAAELAARQTREQVQPAASETPVPPTSAPSGPATPNRASRAR